MKAAEPTDKFTKCPDCGCKEFFEGPTGGIAINLECANCGARFNVALWPDYPRLDQRIGHNPDKQKVPRF